MSKKVVYDRKQIEECINYLNNGRGFCIDLIRSIKDKDFPEVLDWKKDKETILRKIFIISTFFTGEIDYLKSKLDKE